MQNLKLEQTLLKESGKFGFCLDVKQLDKFDKYADFLVEKNKLMNLTAITDPVGIAIKHFLDSIVITKLFDFPCNAKVIDVGTGAGFPGIPLKFVRQDFDLTLVDSLNKRVNFLKDVCALTGVTVECVHARAEDLSRKLEYRESFDVAVSRAVAPMNVLAEYAIPYIKVGGVFLAMKGPNVKEELESSKNAVSKLGGTVELIKDYSLPEENKRTIVVIRKSTETDSIYPRNSAKISKKPL